MTLKSEQKRVALITGGGTGIGAATAHQLLDLGYQVVITGRREEPLRQLQTKLGVGDDLAVLVGDTAAHEDVQHWVDVIKKQFGRLDVVVANAGFATIGWLQDGDPEHWKQMILTNVLGPALMIHYALPLLEQSQGRIILVGSVAGLVPTAGNLYGATKYAVAGMAENVRRAVTHRQIGVTHIAPGRTESDFWTAIGGLPESKLLKADDIARTICWTLTQPAGVDVNTVTVRPFEADV